MRPPRTGWRSTLIVIVAGMAFIVLAILEVMAGQVTLEEGAVPPWIVHIRHMDEALAKKDVSRAQQAWHDAYAAALSSQGWEGLLEVGEAWLRIGEVTGHYKSATPTARRSYRAALFRALGQGSLDGVLGAAEAFARLGDQEVVEQCLRLAESIATRAHDGESSERVTAFRKRMAAGVAVP